MRLNKFKGGAAYVWYLHTKKRNEPYQRRV